MDLLRAAVSRLRAKGRKLASFVMHFDTEWVSRVPVASQEPWPYEMAGTSFAGASHESHQRSSYTRVSRVIRRHHCIEFGEQRQN